MLRVLIGFAAIAALSFAPASSPDAGYAEQIRAWQQERDRKLRSETGWLTLVGLFWLKPGVHTIGSAPDNEFVLPAGSAPAKVGTLELSGKTVRLHPASGSVVRVNGHAVGSTTTLSYNDSDTGDVVETGTVRCYVIQRGNRLAIRAKDSNSPALRAFQGTRYFPIRRELRFAARFTTDARRIPVPNILGETEMQESPGYVTFQYQGQEYRLRPVYEDDTLFFVFKDATSRSETYQAGRMLNTPQAVNGVVDLDFNRAYNPPCTFTPYATCPLPPKENVLPIRIEAGELRYGAGHPD